MLSLTLKFTSGIAELTLDHLQEAGFFQMFWEVLSLDNIVSTCVWALQGVLLADRPVLIGDCDVGSFVVTVLAGEWAIGAILCLVPFELTSLETITTVIRAGHSHKLALPLLRTIIHMSLKATSLTSPLTTQTLVGTVNRILCAII